MKPTAGHALRLAACLCGLGMAVLAGVPAQAQSTAAPAGPPAPAAAAYEDRLISGGSLTPDISAGDNSTSDTTGLARSIRIDAVASVLHQDGPGSSPDTHEDGILANAQWETVSYGAWSANLAARLNGNDERTSFGGGSSNTAFSVQQRAMPFDDGWQTDNGLGDLSAPLINLARTQPRFVLSQGTMLGAATEWRGPDGLQIVAGGGEPGVFDGIKVPTFQTIGGSTYTLGAQWSPAPQWSVGGEFVSANDVSLYYQPLDSALFPGVPNSPRISTDTGLMSAAWQGSGMHAQLNLIDGTVGDYANAFGAWADATMTRGSVTQAFGAFRIDPNLAWGNQLITNDVQGGYYRADYQSRRLTAGFGIDETSSVSGNGADTTFLNADARYQLSRDTGVGGVVNVRRGSDATAWSLEGYLDQANEWGLGRAQLDYATDPQTDDATVTLQQSWKTPLGVRLATTVAVDRIRDTPRAGSRQPGQHAGAPGRQRWRGPHRAPVPGWQRAMGAGGAGQCRALHDRGRHAQLGDQPRLVGARQLLREQGRLVDAAGDQLAAHPGDAHPRALDGRERVLPDGALPGLARLALRPLGRLDGIRFRAPHRRRLPRHQRERAPRCGRVRCAQRHGHPRWPLFRAHRLQWSL